MHLKFYKYQGTGNDFVLINNLDKQVELTQEQIAFICNRKFGIGADGFMLLEQSNNYDFEMKYYNADGNLGSMCGNGGRCIVKFAYDLDLIGEHAMFLAVDGVHEATIDNKSNIVSLEMMDVDNIKKIDNSTCELNTGSPHYVKFISSIDSLNVVEEGRKIRYSDTYKNDGINVNFLSAKNNVLHIRTYERGVEDETLSCGTGVTAAAIAAIKLGLIDNNTMPVILKSQGGELQVSFDRVDDKFTNVILSGPALKSFEGEIEI
jgi:diaminopimelate epimerase